MTLAALLAVAAPLAVALRIGAARRRAPRLPAALPSPPAVLALLPVRDEEANLEPCLRALLAQTAPVRVRVLDDGSTDATALVATRVAAADERVTLLAVPPPPPGSSGKVHALAHGARGADAPWILSIDADARPAPDALARALAAAEAAGLDAISLAATQRVATAGEALLTPLVFALLDGRVRDWEELGGGEGEAVANGQFLLLKTGALAAIGGFDAVRDQPLDDVALARRLRDAGFRTGFWRARETLVVRMYAGLSGSFRGWRRNLALILGHRPALAALASLVALAPLLAATALAAAGRPVAALAAWAGGAAASALVRDARGGSPFYGLFYPADALALASCLGAAVLDRRRGRLAAWRGRRLDPPGAGPA